MRAVELKNDHLTFDLAFLSSTLRSHPAFFLFSQLFFCHLEYRKTSINFLSRLPPLLPQETSLSNEVRRVHTDLFTKAGMEGVRVI